MKILKMTGIIIAFIILVLVGGTFLFIRLSPQFGGTPDQKSKDRYQETTHYEDGKFENAIPTEMDMNFSKVMSILGDYIKGIPNQKPEQPLPVKSIDSAAVAQRPDSLTRLTWFGHSAFLLELDGKNILIDPMFGESPSPVPFFGSKRFSDGLPLQIEELPKIDIVIFSHDHYDHLDYPTIKRLKGKVDKYLVPLGVGAHLTAWDIPDEKIEELNWWESTALDSITFVSTPARHFSGRSLNDRFDTFWCSWVIKGSAASIYFSGDGGYGPHFKEIGEKYGPFDFAMVECGQYDQRWKDIHMLPEETAAAAVDVKSKIFMPIHWGSFVLALHSWYDPVVRSTTKASELGQSVVVPQIGETIDVLNPIIEDTDWWKNYKD